MNPFSVLWPFKAVRRESERADGTNSKSKKKQGDASNGDDGLAAEEFRVTEQLCTFVRGLTADSFRSFPISDHAVKVPGERRNGGSPPSTNVREDLTGWQERHAMIILSKVKELSQLRYILCPRRMKEEHFWRVYFQLVRSYVNPYEIRAIQKAKVQMMLKDNDKSSGNDTIEVEMMDAKPL